jgi:hypothetical protein
MLFLTEENIAYYDGANSRRLCLLQVPVPTSRRLCLLLTKWFDVSQ